MRGSLITGVLALLACVLGVVAFLQNGSIERQRVEAGRLRVQLTDLESLRAENERLQKERVDPAELKRLRDGQAELVRLRGQTTQLRREAQEANSAAVRAQAAAQAAASAAAAATPTTAPTNALPPATYTASARLNVGWRTAAATGGWVLPSGKRGYVVVMPSDPGDGNVNVRALVFQVPEELLARAGLDGLKADGNAATGSGALTQEQLQVLTSSYRKKEGVELINAPQVSVASGNQAQVSVPESGLAIDVTPTITPDKQGVDIVVGAQLNLPRTQPGP